MEEVYNYPTKKDLEFIRKYDVHKKPVKPLIDFIKSIWWMPSWGFTLGKKTDDYISITTQPDGTEKKSRSKYITLQLSCGGWSGNESIMTALEKNEWFYCFYWEESRRGGHYKFEIRKEDWEKK